MNINTTTNQAYRIILRDESNVLRDYIELIDTETPEIRYVDPNTNRQYIPVFEEAVQPVTKQKDDGQFWDKNKITLLLTMYGENRCVNDEVKEKELWSSIGLVLGTTGYECRKKINNLRRSYIRLYKKKHTGKDVKWVHYNLCDELFKECQDYDPTLLETWDDRKVNELLSLYIANINRFRNQECLQKDIWQDISAALGMSQYNCYHKFKSLKRTYFAWMSSTKENERLLKWPFKQYFERIFYNYNPRTGPWDKTKTRLLINAYSHIANKFKNPKFKKKELWKEIASVVGISPGKCDRKFRNLKQTYLKLKLRSETGNYVTKWRYFREFDHIFNSAFVINECVSYPDRYIISEQEDDYVKKLLMYYIEHKEKFKNPLIKKKELWRALASKIGLSSAECDKKFRNLKQTYIRLSEKKNGVKWPYFEYFQQIYDDGKALKLGNYEVNDIVTLTEIRKVAQEVEDRRDNGKKFERLLQAVEESNNIQRERNNILLALLNSRC